MSTRLILIRHGETDWSYQKRYCGFTDVDLNDKGIQQARKLCYRLRNEKIYRVYSSDLKRTLNFARIAFEGLPIQKTSELREINFGIFEGLTHEELVERYSGIYTRWIDEPFCVNIPHGDNLNDFKKRVERTLKRILMLNRNKTIVMITHAGPIKIIINNILNSKDIWAKSPDLASLSIIDFKNGEGKVSLFNDTSYLMSMRLME